MPAQWMPSKDFSTDTVCRNVSCLMFEEEYQWSVKRPSAYRRLKMMMMMMMLKHWAQTNRQDNKLQWFHHSYTFTTKCPSLKYNESHIKLDLPILLKMAYIFDRVFSNTSTTAGLGQLAGSDTVGCASCICPTNGFWESSINDKYADKEIKIQLM